MRKRKEIKIKKKSINIYLILFIFASIFMCIGFAAITSRNLEVDGYMTVKAKDGVFIKKITCSTDENTGFTQNYIYKTTVNSVVTLSSQSSSSTVSCHVEMYNNTNEKLVFDKVSYADSQYSNKNIVFTLNNLNRYDILNSYGTIEFDIVFSYKEGTTPSSSNNTLTSYLNFKFIALDWYNKCGDNTDELRCKMINTDEASTDANVSFSSFGGTSNGNGLMYTSDLSKTEDIDGDGTGEKVYYYRGDVSNNFVYFANYCWRIVRTLENGAIRLIYGGTKNTSGNCPQTGTNVYIGSTIKYNISGAGNAYVGYMYGSASASTYAATHANTNSSNAKSTIDSWYSSSNLPTYSKFLDDYHFCADRSLFSGVGYGTNLTEYGGYNRLYTNKNPQLTCPQENDKFSVHSGDGNASLTYPIALLTADEAYYAGSKYASSSGTGYSNTSNYLYTGAGFWLLTPSDYDTSNSSAYQWSFQQYGNMMLGKITQATYYVRPVINVIGETLAYSGTGTYNNPYVLDTSEPLEPTDPPTDPTDPTDPIDPVDPDNPDEPTSNLWYDNCNSNSSDIKCTMLNKEVSSSDESINFSTMSSSSNGNGLYYTSDLTKTEDLDNDGEGERVYYYRGEVEDNYLLFANYCWRIVRTLEDGGVRLLYGGSPTNGSCPQTGSSAHIGSSSTNFNSASNSNAYVGYMYGSTSTSATYAATHANTTSSTIKSTIDSWYSSNLSSYSSYLDDYAFCNDRSLSSGTGIGTTVSEYGAYGRLYSSGTPQYKCPQANDKFTVSSDNGNGSLTYPIALLSADETYYAGLIYSTSLSNSSNYLSMGEDYWLLSPSDFYKSSSFSTGTAYVWIIESEGRNRLGPVYNSSTTYYIRPTINLIGDVVVTSGTGEYNSPYQVSLP